MQLRRDVFQAIADPTRRGILLLLATQSMTAGAIAAHFNTARPTVSKHLHILTDCALLQHEQIGREVVYHLQGAQMKQIADYLEPFRKLWDDRFNALENIMQQYQKKEIDGK